MAGDRTVAPVNAEAVLAQWKDVHGVADAAPLDDIVDSHRRRRWHDGEGRVVLEHYSIARMAHGTPVNPRTGIGRAGPFLLDAGISSTHHIAHSWGLAPAGAEPARESEPARNTAQGRNSPLPDNHAGGIRKVIEDALRSAGLMG
jgi:hypothetical protein